VVHAVLLQRPEPGGGLLPLALLVEREVHVVELLGELGERHQGWVIERRGRDALQDVDDAHDAADRDPALAGQPAERCELEALLGVGVDEVVADQFGDVSGERLLGPAPRTAALTLLEGTEAAL